MQNRVNKRSMRSVFADIISFLNELNHEETNDIEQLVELNIPELNENNVKDYLETIKMIRNYAPDFRLDSSENAIRIENKAINIENSIVLNTYYMDKIIVDMFYQKHVDEENAIDFEHIAEFVKGSVVSLDFKKLENELLNSSQLKHFIKRKKNYFYLSGFGKRKFKKIIAEFTRRMLD